MHQEASPATNAVVEADQTLSADQRKARQMRAYLDRDEVGLALTLARQLKSSPEREVKVEVISALGWVGKKAIGDLSDLIGDRDSRVAEFALHEWGVALDELRYDAEKLVAITNALSKTRKSDVIQSIFMHMNDIEPVEALPVLEHIITNESGTAVGSCAKESFEFLARESWVSPERTKIVLKKLDE